MLLDSLVGRRAWWPHDLPMLDPERRPKSSEHGRAGTTTQLQPADPRGIGAGLASGTVPLENRNGSCVLTAFSSIASAARKRTSLQRQATPR